MASKTKKLNLKGKSDKKIANETQKWKKTVSADAAKISKAGKAITAAQKKIDTANDCLNKADGYKAKSSAYDALETQIEAQEKLLAKTKSSTKKKTITSKITSLKKDKKSLVSDMKKIASSAGYQKQMSAKTKAQANIKTEKSKISSLKTKKSKDKKVYGQYSSTNTARKLAARKKLQKANGNSIRSKIKAAKKKYSGQTAIYRADLKTSRVFMLGEFDPSETNDQDVPTNAVDKSDPRTNYSVRNSKQLSGTYYLFGKSFSDCDKQYEILQGWARKGVEVTVRGFSKWNHAYLSSVGKTAYTAGNKNSMQLSITFTYAKKGKVAYAKKKTKKKSKSSTGAKTGTKKTTHKTVTVKSGMTYWSIAQSHNVSVSSLEKMNKWPATKLPIGVKVRYQ